MATGLEKTKVLWAALPLVVVTLLVVSGGHAQQQVHVIPADQYQMVDPVPASPQQVGDIDCVFDCGDSDGQGNGWGYICELGSYQAWFGFDVSSIPDGTLISSISFTVFMENLESYEVERSLWYHGADAWIDATTCPGNIPADELVGTLVHGPTALDWETFDIDLSQHDWQSDLVDDRISLMVTGPTNGEHHCGAIYFMEGEAMAFITVGEGVPTAPGVAIVLLALLLLSAAIVVLRM